MNGVLEYSIGAAHILIHFPKGYENCRHCAFCYYQEAFALYRCRLNGAYIERPDLDRMGENCPITWEEQ